MKRLRISSLMDEYTDTEFFPTGGSACQFGSGKGPGAGKRKGPDAEEADAKDKKSCSALAAALVLLMAAGHPYFQRLLVNGELSFRQTADGWITSYVNCGNIVECEDGRLIFNRDDEQRIDITNLVSEETPYIYDGSDPDAGLTYYIIMGGTPECYGWLTWIRTPNPHGGEHTPGTDDDGFITAHHFYLMDHTTGGQTGHMGFESLGLRIVEWNDNMDRPWLLAGAEELGIAFVPTEEFEAMVEAETR